MYKLNARTSPVFPSFHCFLLLTEHRRHDQAIVERALLSDVDKRQQIWKIMSDYLADYFNMDKTVWNKLIQIRLSFVKT